MDRTPRTQSWLWHCLTSLFSLTCFYKLSNQAFIKSTCLLFCFDKSTHTAEAQKTNHTLLAQELTKIANKCGIPTTCCESCLPGQDKGTQDCSWKLADMMTLCNCGITPNTILNLHRTTHIVLDVTIGHLVLNATWLKPSTLRIMDSGKYLNTKKFTTDNV